MSRQVVKQAFDFDLDDDDDIAPPHPMKRYETCKLNDNFEICTTYPHEIRNRFTKRIVKESYDKDGYLKCHLNDKTCKKHRIIAFQWIPNDDPVNKTEVDHRNHVPDDNHIENLIWCTHGTNQKNKTRYNGRIVEYLDELSENAIEVPEYNKHEFEDLWFDPETNCFYYYTGAAYREIAYNVNKSGTIFIHQFDVNNVRATISLNKFKRVYKLK